VAVGAHTQQRQLEADRPRAATDVLELTFVFGRPLLEAALAEDPPAVVDVHPGLRQRVQQRAFDHREIRELILGSDAALVAEPQLGSLPAVWLLGGGDLVSAFGGRAARQDDVLAGSDRRAERVGAGLRRIVDDLDLDAHWLKLLAACRAGR
jgi:hypothetical protein